ncbi:MAG TPA: peptidylprolyl isomerase [Candidatus Acidoferrales bacterium]|nr:peptidylprolyl isomerase [Candidatus Acidoferrales bacterium]
MKRHSFWFSICTIAFLAPAAIAGQTPPPPNAATHSGSAAAHPRATHSKIDPELLHPAALNAKAPDAYTVKFTTTKGDFVVDVTRAWAPLGADRFYNLVKHGFFTDAAFFRVVPGFIIQFGLSADPAVNKAWDNANIKDDRVTQSNSAGTITFAQTGTPNSRTTQLFINLGNNPGLDHSGQGFMPFGKVTSGMDVVQKLYSGYGERPDQGAITEQGKAYLDKNFPNIDSIKSAVIVAPVATDATPKP